MRPRGSALAAGIEIFEPTGAAAQLETSKSFAKSVMRAAGLPTAPYEVFDDAAAARRYVSGHDLRWSSRADGLALGK